MGLTKLSADGMQLVAGGFSGPIGPVTQAHAGLRFASAAGAVGKAFWSGRRDRQCAHLWRPTLHGAVQWLAHP